MRPVTRWERLQNEFFILLVRNTLFVISLREAKGKYSLTGDFDRHLQRTVNLLDKLPIKPLYDGSLFKKLKLWMASENSERPQGMIQQIIQAQREFRQDVDEYRKMYGGTFFNDDAVARGAVNSLSMKIFSYFNSKQPVPNRKAVNAIALLHPLTDVAIDRGLVKPSTLAKLGRLLEFGEHQQPDSDYERILFDLVQWIFDAFPKAQHPFLHQSLLDMHEVQIRSMSQTKEISPEELLDITFLKGGLSTLIAGYLALGELTEKQAQFFFQGGGIGQIMDDLHDISTDLEENVGTVWTRRIRQNESLGPVLEKFLRMESVFESDLPNLTSDFGSPKQFAGIYKFAFKFNLMRALAKNRKYFTRKDLSPVAGHLPVGVNTLKSFMGFTTGLGRQDSSDDANEIIELMNQTEKY